MPTINRFGTTSRMSTYIEHGGTIYLAGKVGEAGKSAKEQSQIMLHRLEETLNEAGSSKDDMITALIHLSDMRYFADFNEVWDAWLNEGKAPCRTCVEANLARPGVICEITVVAAKK